MDQEFSEKDFFLKAFRGLTLTLALSGESDLNPVTLNALAGVVRDLLDHQVKVLILAQRVEPVREFLDALTRRLSGAGERLTLEPQETETIPPALWRRSAPLITLEIPEEPVAGYFERVARLGACLRLPRVLVIHRDGGEGWLDGQGERLSFVNPARLKRFFTEEPSPCGPPARVQLQRTILDLLSGGVGAVSLCRLLDLENELFSYEGQGVFFSRRHYCQVRPLNLDDYPQAAAVIRRGEQEGFLLPRGDADLTAILVQGYGAFISEQHLSGVCGLVTVPYRRVNAGEITALYALTRFQGEGVGGRLVARLIQEARRQRLATLFACVGDPRAVVFFQHHGFRRVAPEALPEEKWHGYDPARKARIICLSRSPGGFLNKGG
ncbi:MAG: GNAT family N-acetyltransferase [Magnetococcales bacterium]|nr:GNAT family N-acetyltransferase [Magnetococcales bacterium]